MEDPQGQLCRQSSSSSSSYMVLLNSLACDLDYMLSDLCTTPPPPYDNGQLLLEHRADAFLEPYMQGLDPDPDPEPGSPDRSEDEDDDGHGRGLDHLPHFRLLDLHAAARGRSSSPSSGDSSSGDAPCDIGLVERLIRSHPVWFLPGIQRAGAFHLLQGKEEGNFVVRQSSQPDTMAISVRLPAGKGPYIEHYLIQAADGQLSLESSDNRFDNIPSLIAHYSQCCDELPVQLSLPRALRDARNRQQLSSLALLGQEFWRYPMANPRPPERSQQALGQHSPRSSGSSLSSFGSGTNNPVSEGGGDAIVLNLAPLTGVLSTFKGSCDLGSPTSPTSCVPTAARGPRPTPPNTLNLRCSTTGGLSGVQSASNSPAACEGCTFPGVRPGPLTKTPPPPPPRWAKPPSSSSSSSGAGQNFTVTTTVTFSVSHATPPPPSPAGPPTPQATPGGPPGPHVEVSCVHVTPKRAPLELEEAPPPPRARRPRLPAVKASQHYRESDILDSPTVYYRSSVADKASDYEDIWGPDMLSSFKPRSSPFSSPEDGGGSKARTPDLLDAVATSPSTASLRGLDRRRGSPGACSPAEEDAAPKQGSPFYAEPADALRESALVPRRRPPSWGPRGHHRHSDPTLLQQWPAASHPGGGGLERIDSSDEAAPTPAALSSSVDNLAALRGAALRRPRGKPVQPPRVRAAPLHGPPKVFTDTSWAVDSSWEFIGNEEDADERERGFPSLEQQESSLGDADSPVGKITVQELIAQRLPTLCLTPEGPAPSPGRPESPLDGISSRISSYDNVEGRTAAAPAPARHPNGNSHPASDNDDTQTIFSEPWDSSRWESLLHPASPDGGVGGGDRGHDQEEDEDEEEDEEQDDDEEGSSELDPHTQPPPAAANGPSVPRTKSFRERLDPLLSPPRLQALRRRDVGASIRAYALHLGADASTTFAQSVEHFIACTRESRESNPQVVMRNMRQFMSGMKNYLVKHGEREFEREVERERLKLKADEFLNLDAILEAVMHRLVVRPLKHHLYQLFVEQYSASGALQRLALNIRVARTKALPALGLAPGVAPPSPRALRTICRHLVRLQQVDSPLDKLHHLLACIAAIFHAVKVANKGRALTLGADDFLPLFVWVLVQSGMVAAEIEAEYMWGLLHPSLLSGEGGYYLTTLSSAVHVLKSFRAAEEHSLDWRPGSPSVLQIVVPDEVHGSIITKTLPVRPNMTTRDVCKIIAHKVRITNPQDYGLFKLVDGEETLLADGECPQDVKGGVTQEGRHCMFAYKRIDAKIAWPRTASPQ